MNASTPIELLLLKIEQQDAVIQKLTLLVQELSGEVASLKAELSIQKNKKNSGNSHIPPSKDENRTSKNQSLRKSSGKKPGGQPEHEGVTLEYTAPPDEVIDHKPYYCNHCGKDLSEVSEELIESRRVIDLPIIKPICTEHKVYRKTCSCGHCMESAFPSGVTASVQYGAGVQATIGYLHARQMMPYQRMQEFFTHVLQLPISTGSVSNLLQKLTIKATPYYNIIKERISNALSVGVDETSARLNGKKTWMWTWQNEELTFIAHSDNRAYSTIEKHFPEGFPNAVLQHDRYAAHFNCSAQAHQICTAHLLRDLQYINELYPDCSWGKEMKALIHEALQLKRTLTATDYYTTHTERNNIQQKLNELLKQLIDHEHGKAITLQKSLNKHADALLTFLYYPKVPPDNNGSERAIRNIKVKQKVSGQFKSETGAHAFAVLRSVIDSAIKNAQNALTALILIANFGAE